MEKVCQEQSTRVVYSIRVMKFFYITIHYSNIPLLHARGCSNAALVNFIVKLLLHNGMFLCEGKLPFNLCL